MSGDGVMIDNPDRVAQRARWAERQRRRSARRRAGEILVTVKLTQDRISTLVGGQFVGEWNDTDPAALRRGIEDLIDWLAKRFGE